MRIFFLNCLIVLIVCISCNNNEIRKLDGKDTTEIMKTVLNSPKFKNHQPKIDSLYIIKSEFVNNSWPESTGHIKIFYIDSERDNAIIDFGPNTFHDKRHKITVPIFRIEKNSTVISLVSYYNKKHYEYNFKLKFLKNKWVIVNDTKN